MSLRTGKIIFAAVLFLTALFTAACDNDNTPTLGSAHPQKIKYLSGNDQTGARLARLAQPFSVQILDTDGNPVPSYKVSFKVTSLSGTLAGTGEKTQEVVTNSSGMTSVYLMLGSTTDSAYTVEASALGLTGQPLEGSPVVFTATGLATGGGTVPGTGDGTEVHATSILIITSPDQDTVGFAGKPLVTPRVAQVLDSNNKPVAGVEVYWTVLQGGGSVSISLTPTDDNGLALGFWTMGQPGLNRLQAHFIDYQGTVHKVIFEVRCEGEAAGVAVAGPDSIAAVSGNGQTGLPGGLLTQPVILAVYDSLDYPITKSPVTVMLTKGGGKIGSWGEDPLATEIFTGSTDSQGLLRLTWRLGPGPVMDNEALAMVVKADGSMASVTITAAARSVALGADNIAIVAGDQQTGEAGALLPLPLVVAVYDAAGNLTPGAQVVFTVTQGGGSLAIVGAEPTMEYITQTTNAEGLAEIIWKLGPGPDLVNEVVAQIRRADGTVDSVTLHVEAQPTPDTANRMYIMSGNLQGSDSSYAVNTLLPLPLVVRVVDTMRIGFADDNLGAPISNFPVLFTAYSPSGDGTLNDQPNIEPAGTGRLNAVTDEDGLAAVRWTLGTKIGDPDLMLYNNKVIAVVVFADGSQDSVVFFATGVPQAASKIAATGGTNLVGIAGKPLSGLSVAISDQFDNPNQGIAVSYVVDQSPGPYTFLNPYGVTDIYGFASASINALSTKAGEMKVSAVNGTLTGSPVTFTITVQADDPAEFLPAGGNNQTSTVGTAFTSALKVLVFDKYRNPVPDVRVAFDITAGSASLSDIYVQTDSDGLASTTVTPNAAGAIKITATTDIGSLTFNLSATAEE